MNWLENRDVQLYEAYTFEPCHDLVLIKQLPLKTHANELISRPTCSQPDLQRNITEIVSPIPIPSAPRKPQLW